MTFHPVSRSLVDLLGRDYMEQVTAASAFFDGTTNGTTNGNMDRPLGDRPLGDRPLGLAEQATDFYPETLQRRLASLLDRVGTRVIDQPLQDTAPGAGSSAFRKAMSTEAAPLSARGYYRVGEDGRLYLVTKSEHYHASLGHSFPGYKLAAHGSIDHSMLDRHPRGHDMRAKSELPHTSGSFVCFAWCCWFLLCMPIRVSAEVSNREDALKFWSFQPVKSPPEPTVRRHAWPKNPIDSFVLSELEHRQLTPVGEADKRTLIRRATFDLTGLPPTPSELDTFLRDDSSSAFESLVDRLLESSAYGQRWGRHWLDVARYADTAGDGADYPVREAGKYRDWVVNAFNADKPFDQFVREQLAGDILAGTGPVDEYADRVTATGFLAIGKRYGYKPSPDYQHLDFADVIDSVGRSLLGLSLGCARCHDHKYDPISAADYYALYGILQSTQWAFPGGEELKRPAHFPPLVPPDEAKRRDEAKSDELARLDMELTQLRTERSQLDRIGLQDTAHGSLDSGPVLPRIESPDTQQRLAALDTKIETLTQRRRSVAEKPPYAVAYGVSEGAPINARIQQRGEPEQLGEEVPRRFLEVLGGDSVAPESSGSGRLELANWISRPTNPLTARVFVNRVWQWHFGQGLVTTSSDFGIRGAPPSHPELLDYLASQFIASGWSVKSLHRLIMQSQTYQLASEQDDANRLVDPDNRWHWKYSRRPLDAESIRDAMLAVSGQLDRSIPDSHPFPAVDTWAFTIHKPFHAVYESNFRSLYLMVQRNRRHPFLALFDAADPNRSVALRQPTTTPTQALFLMNSPFVHKQAEAFARILLSTDGDDETRLALAYNMAHGRVPRNSDVRDAVDFLDAYQTQLKNQQMPIEQPAALAWSALARVLLTSNSFLYVD